MRILESQAPSFRYLWSPFTDNRRYSPYIAGRRVLVGHVDPSPLQDRVLALRNRIVERTPSLLSRFGGLELVELKPSAGIEYFSHYRSTLLELFGHRAIEYAQPDIGVFNGSAGYHVDMPFFSSIFGAWCLDGPDRVVRFPEMGLEVPFTRGTLILFDPAQPHGMVEPGLTEFDTSQKPDGSLVTMASFMVRKTPKVCDVMGVDRFGVRKHRHLRVTQPQYSACVKTGQLSYQ